MGPLSAPAFVPTCLPIALDIPEHRQMLRKPHKQPQCHRGEGSHLTWTHLTNHPALAGARRLQERCTVRFRGQALTQHVISTVVCGPSAQLP